MFHLAQPRANHRAHHQDPRHQFSENPCGPGVRTKPSKPFSALPWSILDKLQMISRISLIKPLQSIRWPLKAGRRQGSPISLPNIGQGCRYLIFLQQQKYVLPFVVQGLLSRISHLLLDILECAGVTSPNRGQTGRTKMLKAARGS